MPVSTDYTGRKKDISIMQGPSPYVQGLQQVTLGFGDISSYCAGVQKLIQRYTIILFTVLGSQKYEPTFGTSFVKQVRSMNLMSETDMSHLFNFANFDAIKVIKNDQITRDDVPLDEQLDSAVLDSLTVSGDSIIFNVRIYTMAGSPVTFLIPASTSLLT